MNTPIVPTPATKKYKHLFFGLVILLSGIILGFVGGVFFATNNINFFKPSDKRIAKHLSEEITEDYPDIAISQKKLDEILRNNLKQFHELHEETAYKIIKIQKSIADEVAEYMPNKDEQKRWLDCYTRYFPGHDRRKKNAERIMRRHRQSGCPVENPPHGDRDAPPPPPPPPHD